MSSPVASRKALDHLGVERLARGDHAPQRRAAGAAACRLASIRYSVGAWQSTSTPSRSISSSRSSGSKRASQISAAAPHSQGATKTLRADFDQPVAVVHQTRSPSRAPEPVLGLGALAGEVALARAAPPRGSPVVPEVKTISAGSSGSRSATAAGGLLGALLVEVARRPRPGHRLDPVRQLAQQVLLADAERRPGRPRSAARGPCAAAGCCRAARRRPSASRRASPAPTRRGSRPAS